MKPILLGGSDFAPMALNHAIPASSPQSGVPSPAMKQVKPFVPVWIDRSLPSCVIRIVDLATISSGAAVFNFATYAASEVGTSAVGNASAAPIPTSRAEIEESMIRMVISLNGPADIARFD